MKAERRKCLRFGESAVSQRAKGSNPSILKSTRSIDILSEVLNSFHFFFFHEEISEQSLEYMIANINKLIIVMMWILQSYNKGVRGQFDSTAQGAAGLTLRN